MKKKDSIYRKLLDKSYDQLTCDESPIAGFHFDFILMNEKQLREFIICNNIRKIKNDTVAKIVEELFLKKELGLTNHEIAKINTEILNQKQFTDAYFVWENFYLNIYEHKRDKAVNPKKETSNLYEELLSKAYEDGGHHNLPITEFHYSFIRDKEKSIHNYIESRNIKEITDTTVKKIVEELFLKKLLQLNDDEIANIYFEITKQKTTSNDPHLVWNNFSYVSDNFNVDEMYKHISSRKIVVN